MSEAGSSSVLKRGALFGDLFRSIELEFGDEGKTLEEQAEAFLRETNLCELVIAWKGNRTEEILKDLPSGLREYILGMLEERHRKVRQNLEEWKRKEGELYR
jgi:hypothetical protein